MLKGFPRGQSVRRGALLSGAALLVAGVLAPVSAPMGRTFKTPETRPAAGVRLEKPADLSPSTLSPLDRQQGGEPITAEVARKLNAELPRANAPLQPARPFLLRPSAAEDRARAVECLSEAVYYEAGFEPAAGQRAVAQVVLNRVRHPAFPKTVCGVVFQSSQLATCQFSFTCDGALQRKPVAWAWRRAHQVAEQALAGRVEASVGGSTHYHADYVAPYWAPRLLKITQIGAHIFYRWTGSWGERAAFGRYAGHEPLILAQAVSAPRAEPGADEAAPDRHADNDVGGRIRLGLGWTPSAPEISSTQSAYARTLAADTSLAQVQGPS